MDAGSLKAGDVLLSLDGGHVEIEWVVEAGVEAQVYNLVVDGLHTYFVQAGAEDVLVHNCGAATRVMGQFDQLSTHGARQSHVRTVGSVDELRCVYQCMARGGTPVTTSPNVQHASVFPDGTRVQYRIDGKSTPGLPSIDITTINPKQHFKVHVVARP